VDAKVEPDESVDAKEPVVAGRAVLDSQESGSPLKRVMKVESQPSTREVEMGEGGGILED
jgi:hypothetical protein